MSGMELYGFGFRPDKCPHYHVGDGFFECNGESVYLESMGICTINPVGACAPVACEGNLCRCPYTESDMVKRVISDRLEMLTRARGEIDRLQELLKSKIRV